MTLAIKEKSDEWYTPLELIRSLGEFDLDPACGELCPHETAKTRFTTSGLDREWFGRVWLNPPFSNASPWVTRLAEHGNGICLVFARPDAKWFQDAIKQAGCVFLLHGRISFTRPGGRLSRCPLGCALIPFGAGNAAAILKANLDGVFAHIVR